MLGVAVPGYATQNDTDIRQWTTLVVELICYVTHNDIDKYWGLQSLSTVDWPALCAVLKTWNPSLNDGEAGLDVGKDFIVESII